MEKMFSWGKGNGNVIFNFIERPIDQLGPYACGYHNAGKALLSSIMSENGYRDNDCYPIFFLYRHSLELYLKAFVFKGSMLLELLKDERPKEVEQITKSHKLSIYINVLKAIFVDRGWYSIDDEESVKTFDEICEVIIAVDDIDPFSYSFRYPTKKNGEPAFEHHFVLNVFEFCKKLDHVLDGLAGGLMGLNHEWQNAAEIIHEVNEIFKKMDEESS